MFIADYNFWSASVSEIENNLWLVMWCREGMLYVWMVEVLQKGKIDLIIKKPGKSHNINM